MKKLNKIPGPVNKLFFKEQEITTFAKNHFDNESA